MLIRLIRQRKKKTKMEGKFAIVDISMEDAVLESRIHRLSHSKMPDMIVAMDDFGKTCTTAAEQVDAFTIAAAPLLSQLKYYPESKIYNNRPWYSIFDGKHKKHHKRRS